MSVIDDKSGVAIAPQAKVLDGSGLWALPVGRYRFIEHEPLWLLKIERPRRFLMKNSRTRSKVVTTVVSLAFLSLTLMVTSNPARADQNTEICGAEIVSQQS